MSLAKLLNIDITKVIENNRKRELFVKLKKEKTTVLEKQEILKHATKSFKDFLNRGNKIPINLTKEEIKMLIIGYSINEYETILNGEMYIDDCGDDLGKEIKMWKENLKNFDFFVSIIKEMINESLFDTLKAEFLQEGKKIDYDTFEKLCNIDFEDLFKQKHGMNFHTFTLKELEKIEKELEKQKEMK